MTGDVNSIGLASNVMALEPDRGTEKLGESHDSNSRNSLNGHATLYCANLCRSYAAIGAACRRRQ